MALLEVQDIQVYYGMIQALKGVSFSVNEGGRWHESEGGDK